MGSRRRSLSRLSRVVLLVGVALAAPLVVPAARAQTAVDDREPTAADKETARSLMDLGADREDAKDYVGALKEYKGAHALVRYPMTGLAVARMQAALGQLVEALDTTAEIRQLPRRAGEGAAFVKARSDAEALTEKLVARTPSIQVTVSFGSGAAKDGAEVSIDGVTLPPAAASLPRKVNPGKHTVVVVLSGYDKATQEIMVPEGGVTPVTIELKPVGSSKSGPSNGGSVGPVKNPNDPIDSKKPPEGGSGGLSPLVYVGFGVGAAGILAGAITGGISISKTNELKDACDDKPCPTSREPDIASANTMANVSNVSFALGAVGAAVGVVGLLLPRSPRQEKAAGAGHVHLMPIVGPGGVGVSGTF